MTRSVLLLVAASVAFTGCSQNAADNEPWREANARLIKEHNLKGRDRTIPRTTAPLVDAGKVRPIGALPKAAIAPGVAASLTWGKGLLLAMLGWRRALRTLPSSRTKGVTVVREWSATRRGRQDARLPAGRSSPHTGTTRSPAGRTAKAVEVFSPVRADSQSRRRRRARGANFDSQTRAPRCPHSRPGHR
jgi:hypothetical protein